MLHHLDYQLRYYHLPSTNPHLQLPYPLFLLERNRLLLLGLGIKSRSHISEPATGMLFVSGSTLLIGFMEHRNQQTNY